MREPTVYFVTGLYRSEYSSPQSRHHIGRKRRAAGERSGQGLLPAASEPQKYAKSGYALGLSLFYRRCFFVSQKKITYRPC